VFSQKIDICLKPFSTLRDSNMAMKSFDIRPVLRKANVVEFPFLQLWTEMNNYAVHFIPRSSIEVQEET
jgi:hypothetical protein